MVGLGDDTGYLSVLGHPTSLDKSRARSMLAVGVGWVVWILFCVDNLIFISHSLWETARYRLSYCFFQGAVKSITTNQSVS